MSPELRLIVAPDRTYAALAASEERVGAVRALRRPLLVAVVFGTSMALSATRHVTPALLVSATVMLSGVMILQILIALAVIGGAPARTAGLARKLDLFFASHAPWSLWMLADAVWVPSLFGTRTASLWLAIVPIVLTPRIIAAYFREVLGLDRRRARVRTLAHQALTWGLFIAIFGAAVAIWPRILQALS